METIQAEVFSMAGSETIICLPGRCHPDCLIRRDQLGLFHQLASSILVHAKLSGDKKLLGDSLLLESMLMERLMWYKQVCLENGLEHWPDGR